MLAHASFIAPWTGHRDGNIAAKSAPPGEALSSRSDVFDREIARRLRWIGGGGSYAVHAFFLGRFIVGACLALVAMVLGWRVPAVASHSLILIGIGAAGAFAGWLTPYMVVRSMVSRRVSAMVAGLPDALELLVICAEAGLSLEEGINRVTTELKESQPELAEEFALTSADLKILPDRYEALSRLANRIDQQNFRSVVTTLTQTMRYGTPLAQALRAVASEMRNELIVNLEERANRLPALLTLPMMLFIMPTIFLIIGGPAILRLIDTFFH